MGTSSNKSSSSGSTTSSSTTTPQETDYEKQINPLDVQLRQALQEPLVGMLNSGSQDITNLLGGNSLGGAYSGIYGVNAGDQQAIVNQSLRDVPTSLQATGMLDSGASQALYSRGAENVRAQLAQFNTQAQQNALGGAFSGIDQLTSPALGLEAQLSQRLQSLRPTTTTGNTTSNQTTSGTNTQSPLQDITGLSNAFGNGTGLGNLTSAAAASQGSGSGGFLSSLGNLFGGQTAGQASLAGTTQGSSTPGGNGLYDLAQGGNFGDNVGQAASDPKTYAQIVQILGAMG